MHIFVDESGSFKEGANVICSILIPETIEGYFKRKFRSFEKTIPPEERDKGEVKGSSLSPESRLRFFSFLNEYKQIYITPISVDVNSSLEKEIIPLLQSRIGDYERRDRV